MSDTRSQQLAEYVDGLRHALAILGVPDVAAFSDEQIVAGFWRVERVVVAAENLKRALGAVA